MELLIVGGGPAGLTAGIYARRAGLAVTVLEPAFAGGQMTQTGAIVNYPGLSETSGPELSMQMEAHARALGVEFLAREVTGYQFTPGKLRVFSGEEAFSARAVILCMGARRREIGCAGEQTFAGRGVSYCATCDGHFFKGREVVVVGGGNTALQDALYLANLCPRVTLIHRRDSFRAGAALSQTVRRHPGIRLRLCSVVEEISGSRTVEAVRVRDTETGEMTQIHCAAVFVAVGTVPRTEGLPLPLDAEGRVESDECCLTPIPGVFVAGDIRKKPLYQIITACADGAVAATAAAQFLSEQGGIGR